MHYRYQTGSALKAVLSDQSDGMLCSNQCIRLRNLAMPLPVAKFMKRLHTNSGLKHYYNSTNIVEFLYNRQYLPTRSFMFIFLIYCYNLLTDEDLKLSLVL